VNNRCNVVDYLADVIIQRGHEEIEIADLGKSENRLNL